MIAALLLLACGGKDTGVDSAGGLTFHGQAWLVTPTRAPAEACSWASGEAIDPVSCWVCVELDLEGDAWLWWGSEQAGALPWPAAGEVHLGAWDLVEVNGPESKYDVGGSRWAAIDQSNAEPWTQTGELVVDEGHAADLWQGSATWPDGVCSR